MSLLANARQEGKLSLWLSIPLGVFATLVLLYLLFANTIIKHFAEDSLSSANSAEVNIDDLSHSLFPFGIEISRLQMTDTANAMRNKIEIRSAQSDVDFFALLSGKLIVEELQINDLAFGTNRESAGEIFEQAESTPFRFPSVEDLPSVDEVLANSPLKTTEAVAQAKQTFDKYEQPLKEKYDALPSKASIEQYKQDVEALKATDYKNPVELVKAKEQFDVLKVKIKADLAKINEFKTLASQANSEMKASTALLKQAPEQDYELLKGLVAGEEAALNQVTQHLFGDKAQLYTQGLLLAIDMLKAEGEAAPQEIEIDDSGLPTVWIKNADISVILAQQTIQSTWKNITEQHALINQATEFVFQSVNPSAKQSLALNGDFKIIDGLVNASQNWNAKGLELSKVELIPQQLDQNLVASIGSALINSIGSLNIVENQLSGNSDIDFKQLALDASGKTDTTESIAQVIEQVSQLSMQANISGELSAPVIGLASDLDKKVVQALASSFSSGDNPKLEELKSKLNQKVSQQLGVSSEKLEELNTLLAATQGDSSSLDDLLKAQLSNAVEDKKDELLNKLTDKLFKR